MVPPSASLLTERRSSNFELRASKGSRLRSWKFDVRRSTLIGSIVMTWCCTIAGCKSTVDNVDIKDVYGPAGRQAKNLVEQAQRDVKGDPTVGLEEFNAAHKLYEEQKYAEARQAMHQIVKKHKKKKEPIVNDALFYRAECDFQLGHYPDAQDGYDELLKNDQATKYLEQSVKRLYAIGRYWLDAPKPASEIELASFEEESGAERLKDLPEAQIPYRFPLTPNFTDKTRPLFDTPGRAVQALKSVSLHDIDGPLADDALMTLATYYLRKKDYREADHYFKSIREQCHKSEFIPASYVLGAHASLKSYQGAQYDGRQLDEAKKLATSAVRLYPDLPQRAKLEGDLKRIDAEAAARAWTRVAFHLKRSEKDAAAVYCETIIEKYPESLQAVEAREELIKLGPQHAAGILKTPLFAKERPQPKPPEAPYDEPEEPARLRISDKDTKPISATK